MTFDLLLMSGDGVLLLVAELLFWCVWPECWLVNGVNNAVREGVFVVFHRHFLEGQDIIPFGDLRLVLLNPGVGCRNKS
jgi:hypothetical protein